MALPSLPVSLLLLLSLSAPLHALSSHSPQDLYAFPRYAVVLRQEGVLNGTVGDLMRERNEASSTSSTPATHLLRTPAGQAFLCTVPAVVNSDSTGSARRHEEDLAAREQERERGLERGLALLEPMRLGCIYQKQNWFTYSFCYGHEIRQFHEVRLAGSVGPTEDPHADSYTLGKAPEPVSAQPPKYGSGSGLLAKKDQRIPATLGGGGAGGVMGVGMDDGGRYLSQVWEDGTVCDKTGLPRTVEVQFHCNTQTIDRIALIRETAICRYVMIIDTPRLCSEAVFLEGRDSSTEPSNQIECQPVVTKLRSSGSVDPPAPPPPSLAPPIVDLLPLPPMEQHGEELGEEEDGSFAELMDSAGVVTLVYDPDTGEMLSAKTAEGVEVFSEEDLRDVVREGGGAQQQQQARREDDGRGLTAEGVDELSELARLMRETLAEALRGVAGDRAPARDQAAGGGAGLAPQVDPVLVNGVEIQGLADLVGAIARGQGRGQGQGQGIQGSAQEGYKQDPRFREMERGVRGSEEHEKLREGWGMRYEDEGEDEEQREGKGRQRDEL